MVDQMNTKRLPSQRRRSGLSSNLCTMLVTALVCMGGLPAHAAVTIPPTPLQSSSNLPPNIMFILDDSTSMTWDYMPEAIGEFPDTNFRRRTYAKNVIYYDPRVDYLPWKNAVGGEIPRPSSVTRVFENSFLAASDSAVNFSADEKKRTFYVPRNMVADDVADYDRYVFTSSSAAQKCVGDTLSCTPVDSFSWSNGKTRTVAKEWENFATWYSFHRTRMKVAKAGASEAFAGMGPDYRVGFTTLQEKNPVYSIPVGLNGGIFDSTNKAAWFKQLHEFADAGGTRYTPLRSALKNVGEYYAGNASSDPFGPEIDGKLLSCRQNFAILTTDGYWNNLLKGSSDYEIFSMDDQEGSDGAAIATPDGEAKIRYKPTAPFKDGVNTNRANTLADVAMKYWKEDLRPDMLNNVPTSVLNPAFWQHMITFGISIGLEGTIQPAEGKTLMETARAITEWPDPKADTSGRHDISERIDDLLHAAVNGRGEFAAANNANEFSQALKGALANISDRLASASNVAINASSINTGTFAFQATYTAGAWIGDLVAYPVTEDGLSSTSAWRASATIAEKVKAGTRASDIYTYVAGSGKKATWSAIGSTRQAQIGSEAVFNYLLGNSAGEQSNGGEFRNRNGNVLGDIVNSSPFYAPDTDTLYVGANDGMLHAFQGATGAELFAFMPGGIDWGILKNLSMPNYGRSAENPHRYFVDGGIAVSTLSQSPDKNILVGALGRGGKGVFALDVTTPTAFTAANTWELTTGTEIGLVLGQPLITRVKTNGNSDEAAVLIGNGINSGNGGSTAGASLLIRKLADGSSIESLDTKAAGDNGLFAPRGWDDDNDGVVDFVYAGDLRGNIWKFDLSTPNKRTVTRMFTAQSGQSITGPLALAKDPKTGKRWVFVGTGKYLDASDPSSLTTQSFYGLIDDGATLPITLADLQQRTVTVTGTLDGFKVRGFESSGLLDSGKKGWYINWPGNGTGAPAERSVSGSFLRGSALIIPTIIPKSDPCEPGGSGFINALDAFTGTSVGGQSYFDLDRDGRFDDDVIPDGNGGTVPVGSVDFGIGMPTLPKPVDHVLIACGSSGNCADPFTPGDPVSPRRVSWREIIRD